jgi:hypothetical protein
MKHFALYLTPSLPKKLPPEIDFDIGSSVLALWGGQGNQMMMMMMMMMVI